MNRIVSFYLISCLCEYVTFDITLILLYVGEEAKIDSIKNSQETKLMTPREVCNHVFYFWGCNYHDSLRRLLLDSHYCISMTNAVISELATGLYFHPDLLSWFLYGDCRQCRFYCSSGDNMPGHFVSTIGKTWPTHTYRQVIENILHKTSLTDDFLEEFSGWGI